MGFIKSLGEVAGHATGAVLGGAVKFVGGAVDSEFIKEIGDGVQHTTKKTGKLFGQAAEGTYKTIKGTVTQDKEEIKSGLKDIGGAAEETVVGVGRGVGNLVTTGHHIVDSAIIGDNQEVKKGLTTLAKGVAIGAIGIGVLDGLDALEGLDGLDIIDDDGIAISIDDIFEHDDVDSGFIHNDAGEEIAAESFVSPHHVDSYTKANGTFVDEYWRDGDGDTSVDLTLKDGGGFFRNHL